MLIFLWCMPAFFVPVINFVCVLSGYPLRVCHRTCISLGMKNRDGHRLCSMSTGRNNDEQTRAPQRAAGITQPALWRDPPLGILRAAVTSQPLILQKKWTTGCRVFFCFFFGEARRCLGGRTRPLRLEEARSGERILPARYDMHRVDVPGMGVPGTLFVV